MSVQLHNALDILELIVASERPLALGTIAERVGMAKPAAHRLLQVLVERGYVEQEPETQAYRATLHMAILGFRHLAATGLRDVTYPELLRLASETGELVRLAVLDNGVMTWIAEAQGARAGLRYDGNLGRQAVLHATAAGKAWLSTLTDEEAVRRVLDAGFPAREETGPRVIAPRRSPPGAGRDPRRRAMRRRSRRRRSGSMPSPSRCSTRRTPDSAVAAIIVVGPSAPDGAGADGDDGAAPPGCGAGRIGALWPIRHYATSSAPCGLTGSAARWPARARS